MFKDGDRAYEFVGGLTSAEQNEIDDWIIEFRIAGEVSLVTDYSTDMFAGDFSTYYLKFNSHAIDQTKMLCLLKWG